MKLSIDTTYGKRIDITREAGDKFFVLADVHSFYGAMTRALEQRGFDKEDPHHIIILLGDMLDRGDAACETYAFFKALKDRLIYVRGNHEDMLFKCLSEFEQGKIPNYAHFINGTVDTVMQFCGIKSFAEINWIYEADDVRRIEKFGERVERCTRSLVEFIKENSVDFATLDDYVFTHGYIPCARDAATDFHSLLPSRGKDDWAASRWINGTKAWHDGVKIEGKTIVCGHWHTSQANSLYHGIGSEWGADADYSPFVDDGIIALDACTAYSGFCNCITL